MISVNTVYQTVLALANKEQRGYITPQEFNLYADHAQSMVFEQYFYDLNQFKRIPGNVSKYADMVDLLEDKISYFKRGPVTKNNEEGVDSNTYYRITDVSLNGKVAEEIRYEDFYKTQYSPLTKATNNRPIFWRKNNTIYFNPSSGDYAVHYIAKPLPPKWTYIIVNEKPLYNDSATDRKNFELHPSEQTELVVKILQLAGIAVKDYSLVQTAAQEENRSIQQEKQ